MSRLLVLSGCTPTPLVNYLKALGVLRLLSEKSPEIRAAWRGDQFVLHTPLERSELENFFLYAYQPTPIMAPWNGGSGFFEKDNKAALQAIVDSTSPRFAAYRECLSVVEQLLAGVNRKASPKGDDKTTLLTRVRGRLPDAALGWFDAAVLMAGDSALYPPLLGTGGNDGRRDFTNILMQRLGEVISLDGDEPGKASRDWLIRFRRFAQGEIAANRFLTLRHRLEDMLFDLSGHDPGVGESQALTPSIRWVADELWYPEQQGEMLAGGGYALRVPYADPRELIMHILKYGPEVEVVEPADLRRAIAQRIREAAKLYKK